MTTQYNNIIVK